MNYYGTHCNEKTSREEKYSFRSSAHSLDLQQYHHHHHRSRWQRDRLELIWSDRLQGSRKSTPFAAGLASEAAAERRWTMASNALKYLSRAPPGTRSGIRSLQVAGLEITAIRDVTPVPHKVPSTKTAARLKGGNDVERLEIRETENDHRGNR